MHINKRIIGSVVAVTMVALLGAQLLTAQAVGGHTPIASLGDGGPNPTATSLNLPRGSVNDSVNQRLFVADASNNRVLVYNTADGYTNGEAAVNVLGQPNFTSNANNLTATGMWFPDGVAYDSVNQRLFVADSAHNRVLVFNLALGITNGMAASNVLGQPNFTTSSPNLTATGMWTPTDVAFDSGNQRLFVSSRFQNRVMVFDVLLITNGEPAVNVLGQPDFTSDGQPTTATGMAGPYGVAYDPAGQRLFVADDQNYRVLVFDVTLITNGEPAVNVLGQPNFTTGTPGLSATQMDRPGGVEHDSANQRLYVGDTGNSRVMVFDVLLITNGEPAVDVYGANDFVSYGTLYNPYGISYDAPSDTLAISDTASRVLLFSPTGPVATPTPTPGPAHNNLTFKILTDDKRPDPAFPDTTEPIPASLLKVYDTNNAAFKAAYGTKYNGPTGWDKKFDTIYAGSIGEISSCTTDVDGYCVANKPAPGDYLSIGRYSDTQFNMTVYYGAEEKFGDFDPVPGGPPGDTFVDVAMFITRDIDKDGNLKKYGPNKNVLVVPGI